MFQQLLYETNDGVATVTLNRQQAYNALTAELLQEITAAITQAQADASVRVVVLTGAGDKAFCAGADLKSGLGMGIGEGLRQNYNPAIRAIRQIPKPVIARLNGLAVGAGCSLALACDAVIATETAYLCQIFVNIGLMPDAGSTFFLPRLIGMQRAFEMASTGRKVYAPEAAAIGLILKSVPAQNLDAVITETVNYYKNAPTKAIGAMKRALNQSFESNFDQMLDIEADGQDVLGTTNDAGEGVMAFMQKRTPKFKGK
jgi:2-(1,2-epoxy-1,2-dihydrophenyl)acetyl-CoA isomerase